MKEPFVNIDTLIEQTKLLGDMELQAYLSSLSEADRREFVMENVGETVREVDKNKSSKFNELFDQAIGADNSVVSAAYYVARTRDLNNLARDVDSLAVKHITVSEVNKDLVNRQHEINEWSNSNKLDTLYVIQVLFVCLSLIGILAALFSMGMITKTPFLAISMFLLVIFVIVLIMKWRFTSVIRDEQYWNKMKFKPKPSLTINPQCPT
jgi:molybdopterin converting factor small subunit